MKISTKVMDKVLLSLVILFWLAPLTVFAQDGFYVIPVAMNKPLKNVITVAKGNGKFTDPVAAVNSITDASASNPYLVVIAPGVYTVTSSLQMKQYVDIAGSGENVTKITGAVSTGTYSTSAIIKGAHHSTLSSLTVENMGGSTYSIALFMNTVSATGRVANVTAAASGGTYCYGVFVYWSSSPMMTNITATASGGTTNVGFYNYYSSSTMTNVTVAASGGTNSYGVRNASSSPVMTNVNATASGAGDSCYGVYNDDSSPVMDHVIATASGAVMGRNDGVFNLNYTHSKIRHSVMKGTNSGLYTDSSSSCTVSQSTIMIRIAGSLDGAMTCIACDNSEGLALDKDCIPIP
jgi:hypothetical protein